MSLAAVPLRRLSRETRAGLLAAVRLGLESLRAEPPQRLSEWAAEHFRLAGESSHQKGAWQAWAFQTGLMDWMSDDRIEEVYVQKSKRVGYTKILTAFIAYNIAHRRRKQAIWQPTDDDRDSFVKSEVDPVLDGVAAVRAARRQGKAAEDTIKYKAFRDSVLHLLGGKAARAYRRITVAVAMLDEWDGFDWQVEKSGDPATLARGRLEGAPYPKFVGGTTPRIKGLSHVERARESADADLRYHLACPHCGAEHPLLWRGRGAPYGLQWDDGRPDTVRHVCPHCRESITQADYLPGGVPLAGTWVCLRTGLRYGEDRTWRNDAGEPVRPPRRIGVHVWSAYSPQRSWESIADEFEQADAALQKGDVGPMQGFANETLGETWELRSEAADEHELMNRREPYRLRSVPVGCLVLVAGIDVQDNRFEIVVWGFGRGEEMWVIDHQVLTANPADERDWDKLDAYLQSRFRQPIHGGTLGIEAAAIDTQGHFTHQVYNFARLREARRILAVRGSNRAGQPIKGRSGRQDVNYLGDVIKDGVKVWEVGTDTAKDLLHGRLRIVQPGPGCIHFSDELPLEFFEQLTAEGRALQRTATGEQHRWVKRRARNEVLDCTVYALFAAQVLDLHRYTEKMWDRLEAAVQPPPDLFAPPAPAHEEEKEAEEGAWPPPQPPIPPVPAAAPATPFHPEPPVVRRILSRGLA